MCLKGQMEEGGKREGLVHLSILSIHVVISTTHLHVIRLGNKQRKKSGAPVLPSERINGRSASHPISRSFPPPK